MQENVHFGGRFILECYDPEGKLKWVNISKNGITTQGLNHILNTEFNLGSVVSTWYCGLVSTNTAFVSTMTYAAPTFTESSNYSEANRPTYTEASSAAALITNSSNKAAFTMSASTSIFGAALFSANVKADTATTGGILFCYSLLSTSRDVLINDVINLTYQVGAS